MTFFRTIAALWVLVGTIVSSIGMLLVAVAFVTGDRSWLTTFVFGASVTLAGVFLIFALSIIEKSFDEFRSFNSDDISIESTAAQIMGMWDEEAAKVRDSLRDKKGNDEPS